MNPSAKVVCFEKHSSDVNHQIHNLPENPIVVIEPSRAWVAINLRDLWSYRDLLYILTARDVKVRYKQTALGAAWAIIQPLVTMLIFTIFSADSPVSLPTVCRIRFSPLPDCCRGFSFPTPSPTAEILWSATQI